MRHAMELYFTRYLLAGDPLIQAKDIEELSRSEHINVRARISENPKTPLPILLKLAKDTAPEVRVALTYNPALLPFVSHELAWDENPDVRYALAENLHAPIEALRLLAADENPYVSDRATKTLNKLQSGQTQLHDVMAEAA